MFSVVGKLEHKIGERVFHFFCDANSPTSEVKEALSLFFGHVIQVEKDAAEAAAKAAASTEAAPEEQPKEESK